MCWQLRGTRQVLGEELKLGFAPFLPPGLLLPFPLVLWSFYFPLSLHLPAFSYVLGVLGERGGLSNLARASGPFLPGLSAFTPFSFCLISFPS